MFLYTLLERPVVDKSELFCYSEEVFEKGLSENGLPINEGRSATLFVVDKNWSAVVVPDPFCLIIIVVYSVKAKIRKLLFVLGKKLILSSEFFTSVAVL